MVERYHTLKAKQVKQHQRFVACDQASRENNEEGEIGNTLPYVLSHCREVRKVPVKGSLLAYRPDFQTFCETKFIARGHVTNVAWSRRREDKQPDSQNGWKSSLARWLRATLLCGDFSIPPVLCACQQFPAVSCIETNQNESILPRKVIKYSCATT